MNKDLIMKIRTLNQNALKYLGSVGYLDDEVCGEYTYQFCAGVLRVADRMNEKRKVAYLTGLLRKVAQLGGKPLHDYDLCDTGLMCDERGCTIGWIIRPMSKFLSEPSDDPFNPDVTTIAVYITDDPSYGKWTRHDTWLRNTNAKEGGSHYPF